MSKVYFTSDLHFGHANIIKFSGDHGRQGSNSEEHDEWLIEEINKVVKKRDIIWILGDVAIGKQGTKEIPGKGWDSLAKVGRINGSKKLILGNHDDMPIEAYQIYFHFIRGMFTYKRHWLTHAPIHPDELRGRPNIHGHTHHNSIQTVFEDMGTRQVVPDENYINVCVEDNLKYHNSPVVEFSELIKRFVK